MLHTYQAILKNHQLEWLEEPPALASHQPIRVYLTILQDPTPAELPVAIENVIASPVATEDALLQLAGVLQSPVTDIGERHDEYIGQSLIGNYEN